MQRILLTIFLCLWTSATLAQTYPSYTSTKVNDFAELLSPEIEAALSQELATLRRDTGVEMTVVTLRSQAEYAPDETLERFATGLFNHWGIGNKQRNDGVLVLVIHEDRAMRIELGAGYGRDWDRFAQRIVDQHFLPNFREEKYERGITHGTVAIIRDIINPFLGGSEAPKTSDSDSLPVGMVVLIVAVVGVGKFISHMLIRLKKCPNCGNRALRRSRRTITRPTRTSSGTGEKRIYCTNCDYSEETTYTISRKSRRSSSGGFGGGSSGGGGASGRW